MKFRYLLPMSLLILFSLSISSQLAFFSNCLKQFLRCHMFLTCYVIILYCRLYLILLSLYIFVTKYNEVNLYIFNRILVVKVEDFQVA